MKRKNTGLFLHFRKAEKFKIYSDVVIVTGVNNETSTFSKHYMADFQGFAHALNPYINEMGKRHIACHWEYNYEDFTFDMKFPYCAVNLKQGYGNNLFSFKLRYYNWIRGLNLPDIKDLTKLAMDYSQNEYSEYWANKINRCDNIRTIKDLMKVNIENIYEGW